jgi:hypothetical protein
MQMTGSELVPVGGNELVPIGDEVATLTAWLERGRDALVEAQSLAETKDVLGMAKVLAEVVKVREFREQAL